MSPELPTLKPKDVIKALKKAGFVIDRVRGSHYIMKHPTFGHRFPVPFHNTDLKKGLLHGIIKQAGLTRQAFLELL
jgi:predicted RNA binding protein YcfA (HicA-like mRNA interferase family)